MNEPAPLRRALGRIERVGRLAATAAERLAGGGGDVAVGRTPRRAVWRDGRSTLWRYGTDDHDATVRTPVLVVHSLVSKAFILDLQPGNSVVETLLRRGLAVYLLEFGEPDARDAGNTLATYADVHLPAAAAAARADAASDGLLHLGYCMGGTLLQLALADARNHEALAPRGLATLATPIDWPRMGLLTALFDGVDVADLVDTTGNMPPVAVERIFRTLQPTNDLASRVTMLSRLGDERWLAGYDAMQRWMLEQVPFPGAALEDVAELLVRRNGLVTDDLRLDGRERSLATITCPVLVVAGRQDHIVPRDAALPDPLGYGGEVTVVEPDAGHVGMIAGRQAATTTLPAILDWLVDHA